MTSGSVSIDETTMCERQRPEQPADERNDAIEVVSIDEMVERVRRWLFEQGNDPTPT